MGFILNPYRFGGGPTFTDPTSISGWHSLFWADGPEMQALGYSNTDPVSTWANEITAETDLSQASSTLRPTFVSSNSTLNNQPAVSFDGAGDYLRAASFSSSPTFPATHVVIFEGMTSLDNVFDGVDASARNVLFASGAAWAIFAQSTRTGGSWDGNAHMAVAYFTGSAANDRLDIDNTTVISGSDAGNQVVAGLTLGANYLGSATFAGDVALYGFYDGGDITADPLWGDFKTWVTDTYGITLA